LLVDGRSGGFPGALAGNPDRPILNGTATPAVERRGARSDFSVIWAADRLYPIHLGQGPTWDNLRHKMDLCAETALNAGFADEKIADALSKCWLLKQVGVAR
jgi:hypothetical protein